MSAFDRAITDTLAVILRPIVRYCLRHSMGIQELYDVAKRVFVNLAVEELEAQNTKVTTSRLSVITGIQRPAVKSCLKSPEIEAPSRFTSRVITQWRRDSRFLTESRRPRVLSYEGDESEFRRLVHAVSTDLHPKTVLFDLQRLGIVEITSNGVKLIARAYRPVGSPGEIYRMLGRDVEELMLSVMENIEAEARGEPPKNFHAYTYFDAISDDDLDKLRKWLIKQGSAFHQKVERHLAKYDLDLNRKGAKQAKGAKRRRIAFGSFSRSV